MNQVLHIRWNKIVDPQGHAECLIDLLDDLKPEFQQIGYENTSPGEDRKPWQKAPTYSEVGKSFESSIPTWKVGYWIDRYEALGYPDEWVPPVTGTVQVMFIVPDYKRYMVANQSRLAYMLGRQPHEFEGFDTERLEKATRLLHEALYRVGMHPGGPYPPDDFNWNMGL